MAIIVNPSPGHGSILKRLKETIEAERRQHILIVEEMAAGQVTSNSSKNFPLSSTADFSQFLLIVAAQRKGKNAKTTRLSTPPQATTQHDESLRIQFDQRISALERDNVELKRDNVELKNTVDRVSIMKLSQSLEGFIFLRPVASTGHQLVR